MFEKSIESEKIRLMKFFNLNQQYTLFSDITQMNELPVWFKTFCRAEVDWWIYNEDMIRKSNQNFDFKDPDFVARLNNINELYKKNARFSSDNLKALIDQAVKTRLNLICRPRTTLRWFIFRGEPTKTVIEVLKRLVYFEDENYLIAELKGRIQSHKAGPFSENIMSAAELERLVQEIDDQLIYDLKPSEFLKILEPIFVFFSGSNFKEPELGIPIESLIIFMDDKGLIPISNALNSLIVKESRHSISYEEFGTFLNKLIDYSETPGYNPEGDFDNLVPELIQTDEGSVPEERGEDEFYENFSIDELTPFDMNDPGEEYSLKHFGSAIIDTSFFRSDEIKQIDDASIEDENPSSNDTWADLTDLDDAVHQPPPGVNDVFVEDMTTDQIINEPDEDVGGNSEEEVNDIIHEIEFPKKPLINGKYYFVNSVSEDLLNAEENFHLIKDDVLGFMSAGVVVEGDSQTLIESAPSINKSIVNLEGAFSDEEKAKFCKKLFRGNQNLINELLQKLEVCSSWRDAAASIDLFFASHNISPDSAMANEFIESVQQIFLKN